MKENGELPPWVLDRVSQSSQLMGMAVSYVSFHEGKQAKKQEEAKKKTKKPTVPKRKKT
jgi:hypothetical protein